MLWPVTGSGEGLWDSVLVRQKALPGLSRGNPSCISWPTRGETVGGWEVAAWMGHENFIANLRVISGATAVGRANVGRAGTWGLLLLF